MTVPTRHAVTGPAAWTVSDLEADRSWELDLTSAQAATLRRSAEQALAAGRELVDVTRANFDARGLEEVIDVLRAQLERGRGLAVLRGMPVDEVGGIEALPLIERMYWGLLVHLGTGITKNSDASLIHYVTDGAIHPNQGTRGVGLPVRSPLHVDLTDAASLLCIQQASDSPPSWLASSSTVHNVLLERSPEALELLYRGFRWDRLEEHAPFEDPASSYLVPVFSEADGVVSCRYNRYWMAMAQKRTGESTPRDAKAAMDLFDEVAHEHRLDVEFGTGDVQFINNYVVLHGRDEHAVDPAASFNRLLMRIWIDFDDGWPTVDPAVVRYGIVRHGNLGWTAEQLRAGLPPSGHPRLADGRPAVA